MGRTGKNCTHGSMGYGCPIRCGELPKRKKLGICPKPKKALRTRRAERLGYRAGFREGREHERELIVKALRMAAVIQESQRARFVLEGAAEAIEKREHLERKRGKKR